MAIQSIIIFMIIIFYTTQPEICHVIAEKLIDHSCFIFTRQDLVFSAVTNMINPPDLIVADYMVYNHNAFNVYHYMYNEHKQIPLIFYNDPCIPGPTRVQYWQHFLKYRYPENMDFTTEEFTSVLRIIEETIESKEIKPYVKLMQNPKPLPDILSRTDFYEHAIKTNSPAIIYEFKEDTNMPNCLFNLLEILFEFKDQVVTLEELQKRYSKIYRTISINSLKVHISQLNTMIQRNEKYNFVITKRKDGYLFRSF